MKNNIHILNAVFPNKCMGCGEIIDENIEFCEYCKKHLERNNLKNICTVCGYEKENCVCKYNVYRFEKVFSVFKNSGVARRAYYTYKFKHTEHYADFFAGEISDAVKQLYGDINFECMCAVPASKGIFGAAKFNHCDYLCKSVSKLLNIPYENKLLYCKERKKQQHKLSLKERLSNVNGKFGYNYGLKGGNVLLVDDIRTTGATLDECAKTLLYAGADRIYCATVLSTEMNFKMSLQKHL